MYTKPKWMNHKPEPKTNQQHITIKEVVAMTPIGNLIKSYKQCQAKKKKYK